MEPVTLILGLFQIEWLLNYLAEHGASLLTLAVVIIWASISFQKLTSEHGTIMKKLGLIPMHKLTEDEQSAIVVSRGQLRQQFEEHRAKMAEEFVTVNECERLHSKTEKMLDEIVNRGKQHRKEDS